MKDLRFQMEARQSEVKAKQIQVAEGQAKVDKLDQMLKDQRQLTDRAQKELDLVLQKVQCLSKDFILRIPSYDFCQSNTSCIP
jgi:uncharacterized coiled-coil protein SlyX